MFGRGDQAEYQSDDATKEIRKRRKKDENELVNFVCVVVVPLAPTKMLTSFFLSFFLLFFYYTT